MNLRIIRLLLWLIRHLGFAINASDGPGPYQWVRSPSGAFDHWFYTPERTHSVCYVAKQFGSWPVIWRILHGSELLIGGRRWVHHELIRLRSEQYYCSSQLRDHLAAHAVAQFLAADPQGDVLAQTAAAYRVADAMMQARLPIRRDPGLPRTREHTDPCKCTPVDGPNRSSRHRSWPTRPLFHFSGDTVKQTLDGLRQLLSLRFLKLAIAVLPEDHKEDLIKHIRPYLQDQISRDTI